MDGSLIVILGFPVLYLTGSLRKAAAPLKVSAASFALYFLCTAALLLLPAVRVASGFSICFAGVFFCFAPVAALIRQRSFPVGLPVAAALCVLLSCVEEMIWGDFTIAFLPYVEGAAIALAALLCTGRRAALFAPLLSGLYEAAAHVVRIVSGMDATPWSSGICATSVAIAVSFFAAAVLLRQPRRVARHARHAET
jgi:hypothetical protein